MRIQPSIAAAFAAASLFLLLPGAAGASEFSDAGNVHFRAPKSAPTFDDCFRLAWVRGVHVERFEFASFEAESETKREPNDSGVAAGAIKRQPK